MRRLVTSAAFLLVLTLTSLCAQRGGRAGGFSHGGFAGARGGLGGHSSFVSHGVGSPGPGASHFGSHAGFAGQRFRGEHFRGDHLHSGRFGFRNRCYGCWANGYPYYYYDPFLYSWWWDNGSFSNEDYVRDRQVADEMNEQNLDEQRMLREQDQDAYARRPIAPRSVQPVKEEQAHNDPPTVLVFRNEQKREIQNYAIADGILWNFAATRTEKIPLAIIDIPATVRANDERGVDFHIPGPGEGQ